MSWFGTEIDGPLVLTRAVHFAATAVTAGALMFCEFVIEPALRPAPADRASVQARIIGLAWTGLALTVVTGLIWLTLETMSITGLGSGEAMKSGAMLTVINETRFGLVSAIRNRFGPSRRDRGLQW